MSKPIKPGIRRARICHRSFVDDKKEYSHWMPIKMARELLRRQTGLVITFWIEIDPSVTHVEWKKDCVVIREQYRGTFGYIRNEAASIVANEAITGFINQQFLPVNF